MRTGQTFLANVTMSMERRSNYFISMVKKQRANRKKKKRGCNFFRKLRKLLLCNVSITKRVLQVIHKDQSNNQDSKTIWRFQQNDKLTYFFLLIKKSFINKGYKEYLRKTITTIYRFSTNILTFLQTKWTQKSKLK